jgi:membrane protein
MGTAEAAPGGSRAKAAQDWLARRADTRWGRLGTRWFRAYFAASRNSACAATLYSALSVLPTALVGLAYFHLSDSDANAFADRVVAHLRLDGTTAALVHDTFGSTSSNVVAATLAAVIGFLLWGIGIGQIFRDVYARAWNLEITSSASDQVRFTVFFFVFTGALALLVASASTLRGNGWFVLVTVWTIGSVAYWLWVPSYLLRRAIGLRRLLPGAILASFVVGGTVATAPFYLAPTMNQNGAAFGSFGVVLTLLGYFFIVITIAMICAVFAPVWAAWQRDER